MADAGGTPLALFPLQSVLYPGGVLPLRIFEVRYLDLIARCHKDGLPFGVVCLTQGREVRSRRAPQAGASASEAGGDAFAPESFHAVGTLAHIVELARPQPGLMVLRCSGGQRFRLQQQEQLKHGLWTGQAQLLPADAVLPVPPDLLSVRLALEQLVARLQKHMNPAEPLPLQTPYRWDDCGWLANRWCELLPLSNAVKQQLMALDSPLLRLELVADALAQFKINGTQS